MATDVEIASLALSRIGHASISSFSSTGNKEQRWFHANYETIKKALLSEHPWNFAIKRATLSSTTAPTNEYTNAYTLPNDFLRLVRLNGDSKAGYRVERGTLATYEASAVIEYIFDVTDEATFSASFTDLLAQRLAAEVCFYMTDNASLTEMSWKVFQDKLTKAKSIDSRESAPRYRASNLALARLGETSRQGEDGSYTLEGAARLVESLWDSCRKDLLRAHTWNFASKSAALVSAGSGAWTLPNDFIRAVRINSSDAAGFRILNAQLLTSETAVTLEYVYDVSDETKFDTQFAELLAHRIAAEAATAIMPSAANAMWSSYQQKLAVAIDTDTREQAAYNVVVALAIARLGDVSGKGPLDQMNAKKGAIYRTLQTMYNYTRKALLREHNWNFAVKRAILTKSTIRTITGATAANPVVITSAAHGFANGETVYIDSIIGMTELNGRTFTVANQATNTFQLSGENGTAYTAYSSGGSAYPYIAKEYRYRFALPADCLRLLRINRTEADEYRVEGGYIYTDEADVDIEYVYDASDETAFDPQFIDVFAQRLAAEAAANLNPGASGAMWNIYENKIRMARTMNSREGTPRGLDADTWMDSRA